MELCWLCPAQFPDCDGREVRLRPCRLHRRLQGWSLASNASQSGDCAEHRPPFVVRRTAGKGRDAIQIINTPGPAIFDHRIIQGLEVLKSLSLEIFKPCGDSFRQHCGRSQSSQIPSVVIDDGRNPVRFPLSSLTTVAIRSDSLRPHLGRSQSSQIPSVPIWDGRNPARFPPSPFGTIAIQPDSFRPHLGRSSQPAANNNS
jgi:hypothetical protein